MYSYKDVTFLMSYLLEHISSENAFSFGVAFLEFDIWNSELK